MNTKQKELVKIFLFLWIFLSIVFNWNSISWIFNYRVGSTLVYDFFNPYTEDTRLVSASEQENKPAPSHLATTENLKSYPYTAKSNSIEIPSLNIEAPIVIAQSTEKQALVKDLDNGTVYYPGSVLPGQKGQIAILGHSAPPGWPKIKYDWVFSDINSLKPGDLIIINFNNKQYTYKVKNTVIIKPGEDLKSENVKEANVLTIISCWPPGKDYKRIAVESELIK
ncbi:MAG: sortase [bacterium]|nr:sortase [bacterium]